MGFFFFFFFGRSKKKIYTAHSWYNGFSQPKFKFLSCLLYALLITDKKTVGKMIKLPIDIFMHVSIFYLFGEKIEWVKCGKFSFY